MLETLFGSVLTAGITAASFTVCLIAALALGALAVLTLPELLHGLCRGRDLRCAMILLLLVSAAALWALSGLFLLPLPLAMALAWVWQRLCDRGAAVSAAVPAAVLALCAVSSILFMF